jgi:preprotein translocase subunit SecG
MQLLITFLYILFVLAAIVLVVVILLQEGKGGGLTDALGTSGQATFGVGSSGINRFTGVAAAVFLASAVIIHVLNQKVSGQSVIPDSVMSQEFMAPPEAGAPPTDGAAPPAAGTTPPAGEHAPGDGHDH